jgi:hypothetical protein
MTGRDQHLWTEAIQLDCASARSQEELQGCIAEMQALARDKVMAAKTSASNSLQALRNLLRRLATV